MLVMRSSGKIDIRVLQESFLISVSWNDDKNDQIRFFHGKDIRIIRKDRISLDCKNYRENKTKYFRLRL